MTGRMELNTKYENNINQILAREPKYMNHFNVFMVADNKTAITRLNYISDAVKFIHYLEDNGFVIKTENDFSQVTINDVRMYLQWDDNRMISERGRISDSYKYLRHFSLNCLFNFLEDNEIITKNPMNKIKTPKNDRMNKKLYLGIPEVKEIEMNANNGKSDRTKSYTVQWKERDAAIINLGFETGLRVSAIVSINLEDINWEEEYINTIEKGNRPRQVFINKRTADILKIWIKKRNEYVYEKGIDTQALFITKKQGRISALTIGRILRSYAGDLNKNGRIKPHTMRSSKGNNIVKVTGNVEAARIALGHSNISTTQKYLEDSLEQQKKIASIDIYGDEKYE